jgi:hypothetical protein
LFDEPGILILSPDVFPGLVANRVDLQDFAVIRSDDDLAVLLSYAYGLPIEADETISGNLAGLPLVRTRDRGRWQILELFSFQALPVALRWFHALSG